jgi:hypothetical protein
LRRRNLLLSIVVVFIVTSAVSLASAIEFTKPFDDGDGFTGFGGGWEDYPGDGRCEIYMNAAGLPSEVYCWIGSDLEFSSTESVSMDGDLHLIAYMLTSWPAGAGQLKIYFECRYYSTEKIKWEEDVYGWPEGSGGSEEWNNDSVPLTLNGFPKSTPAGHWYFCVRIDFIGSWGAVFQLSEEEDNTRAELYVDSLEVTY